MSNFFNVVLEVLKQEERFFSAEGELLRNAVYEAAMQMDASLIKLLYSNETTKARFFTDVDGIAVFDKVGFGWVINNREFLPDSYTRYKNKIGLVNQKGDYISASNDVELVFPYKDCVLEGGQTKEDQKRSEIFYNETLAPNEVDRLLGPKILSNANRYTANGKDKVSSFSNDENLIIKGNNLLSISSLLVRYEGKIKLVYIDPPYNTGGDANIFSYNNTFNHSTWLTFMKNRLSVAKRLMRQDGFIVVAIDHFELFYLGALMDEMFGKDNRVGLITVQHNPKGRNFTKWFSANCEYMLVYAKDVSIAAFNEIAIDDEIRATFTLQDEGDSRKYRLEPFMRSRTETLRENKPDFWYPLYVSQDLSIITRTRIEGYHEVYPIAPNGKEATWINLPETFDEKNAIGWFVAKREDEKIVIYRKYYEQQIFKNVWIDKKYQSEFNGTNLLKDLIGKNKFSYPKSLYAVVDIIKIMSSNNDIVLDFFGGSGTTAHAVLHANKEQNMKRRFILCEQLDEHIEIMHKRMQAVLKKENINDSFVGCDLLKLNQIYADDIQVAEDEAALVSIWHEMIETGFISCKVDPKSIDTGAEDFKALSLENKKKLLMELLDKNQLYVNYCDMDDETFAISEEDKAFTKSFYGEV